MATAVPVQPSARDRAETELESTWRDFVRTRDSRLRDKLILTYAPLVKYVAGRLCASLPDHVEKIELVGDGLVGLIEAVDRYRPGEGAKFESFALPRIRGAMLDRMRSADWAPRSVRSTQKRIEQVVTKLEQREGVVASWDEVAAELGLTRDQLDASLADIGRSTMLPLDAAPVSGDDDDALDLYGRIADVNADEPGAELELEDRREALVRAIDALPERERLVLVLFYYEELPLKDISSILGVTESRVSQLQGQALVRLRTRLHRFAPEPALAAAA